ncbi:hypothetical protein ACF068_14615 [Streptomyces sp. NPDC016309]|uniref:hypothetical protein n=1 Tax=Streptomyces sp. NPDC016309 TaxID=3364965 RepID=UPI0036FEF7B9
MDEEQPEQLRGGFVTSRRDGDAVETVVVTADRVIVHRMTGPGAITDDELLD